LDEDSSESGMKFQVIYSEAAGTCEGCPKSPELRTNIKGFSAQNLWRMKQFNEKYKDLPKPSTL